MKHTKKRFAAYAILLALSAPGTQAATIVQTVWNSDWNGAVWGTPAAAPTSGNDYVTAVGSNNVLRMPAGTGNSTFGGGSLRIVTGTIGLIKSNNSIATINGPFTLDGGTLNFEL